MKGAVTWSHRPYRPLLTDIGEPYICRVCPSANTIHFEWLEEKAPYEVFCRERGTDAFEKVGETDACAFTIEGLCVEKEYEFYVTSGEKRSLVRLARCGEMIGTVVNYLHPDDLAYSFSGRFLCSPSLIRHPDGYLLASMDVYADQHPQNLTLVFRSDDEGETWQYQCEVMPCFWGRLFLHKGQVYLMGASTEYGDLLLGRSPDGGKSFEAPVALLRGSNGKNGNAGVHQNPQNVYSLNGRMYFTFEWGTYHNHEYGHAAMVASVSEDADLLDVSAWSFTPPRCFEEFTPAFAGFPTDMLTIEGTLAQAPDGRLLNIMRYGRYGFEEGKALAYEVDTTDPDAPLKYSHLIEFPRANFAKFMIKYDEKSGYYYSINSRCPEDKKEPWLRCILSLMRSRDLQSFEAVCDLYDFSDGDTIHTGLQYVCFLIEGDDIIYLCRTAINGANDYHNSNTQTFHRIKNFRQLSN